MWFVVLITVWCLVLLFIQAKCQAVLFKHNKSISHTIEAIKYLAVAYIPLFVYYFLFKVPSADFVIIGLTIPCKYISFLLPLTARAGCFDIILNLFRGKAWWYNGSGTSSELDHVEGFIPLGTRELKIIYMLIFILNVSVCLLMKT